MRNENRCESENSESHILKTSGRENSCDNNSVNHLNDSNIKVNDKIIMEVVIQVHT